MNYADALASTIMRRYPDPDQYPYRSWSYSQGFMLWGMIRLYEKTKEPAYRAYVLRYCEKHVTPAGAVPCFTGCSLDDIMTGSVLVWAYQETGERKYCLACDRIRQAFDDYPRNQNKGFWHGKQLPGEMWVDGLFMGLMFLVRYGKYIGDQEYCYAEAVQQLSIAFDCCEKDGTGLLYHAYSEDDTVFWAHPISGKSPEIWCEGLGWYAMILVDVLSILPREHEGYGRLSMQLEKLARGLRAVQDPASGLWYQVVDKPRTIKNWHDTSGSAMFVYTLGKASALGLIDKSFAKTAAFGFSGVKTKCLLNPEGNMDVYDACDGLCVQADYGRYVNYPRNVNCKEAIASVLWATVEME